ncbi:MAG: hypothetical protein Q8P12_06685 [bacterium]|nr:hypothetical protein [bacterium]
MLVHRPFLQGQIVDPNHLPPMDINDLLIEQILAQQQQTFIRLKLRKLLLRNTQTNPIGREKGYFMERYRTGRFVFAILDQKQSDSGPRRCRDRGQLRYFPDPLSGRVINRQSQKLA